jgi:hypothetical protein
MTYVDPNFRNRRQLIDAVKSGKIVHVYEHGIGTVPKNGKVYLEGPHYPESHTWYAIGIMKNGKLIKVS